MSSKAPVTSGVPPGHCSGTNYFSNILLNLRSPRDCGSCRSRLWYILSPLDGASVREAHCAQACTVVRRTEAPCAQATGRPI